MTLLEDIIHAITGTDEKTSSILRKCLVLSYRLKNDDLKTWVSKELNGYERDDPTLPEYRRVHAQAKGLFLGGLGSQINDQPLPPAVLKPEHRHFAETAILAQALAAYEGFKADDDLQMPWPPNLTAFYQSKFFQGDMSLNRAWQEIPGSCFVSLTDTVRTRVLTFVLELQEKTTDEKVEVEGLSPSTVQALVHLTVIGGNNVFGSVQQFTTQTVQVGDVESLRGTLSALGIENKELDALEAEIEADLRDDAKPKSLGKRAMSWIGRNAASAGKGAIKLGADMASTVLTEVIKRYLGL